MANNKKFIDSEGYNKHLDFNTRAKLQKIIVDYGTIKGVLSITLKEVAEMLEKDPTTISKEVKKHRIMKEYNNDDPCKCNSICANYTTCEVKHLCGKSYCNFDCKKCIKCKTVCDKFVERTCPTLKKFPFVCNGCGKLKSCNLTKYFYYADRAQDSYKSLLKSSREGIDVDEDSFKKMDKLIVDGLAKKQPLYHIYESNIDDMTVSLRTLYNYFDCGYLTAKSIDLPRKVIYKPRYSKKIKSSVYRKMKVGRMYEDYVKYVESHSDASIVEMDTVEGIKGHSGLLTLHFVKFNFQLAFKLESICFNEVLRVFNYLILISLGIFFDQGATLSISEIFTFPIFSSNQGIYKRGFKLLAIAVSIIVYIITVFLAPSSVSQNSQFFLPTANPLAIRSAGLLSISNLPSSI